MALVRVSSEALAELQFWLENARAFNCPGRAFKLNSVAQLSMFTVL